MARRWLIVDAKGMVLNTAEDGGNDESGTAAAPSDYKTVLSGQPTGNAPHQAGCDVAAHRRAAQQQSVVAGALYLSAPIQEDIRQHEAALCPDRVDGLRHRRGQAGRHLSAAAEV